MKRKIWKYWVLRAAYIVLGRLSLKSLYGIAHFVGDAAYYTRRGARRAVTANMRQVMGPKASRKEVRAATREVFRNATRYYADLLHVPRLDVKRFRKENLDLVGEEYLRKAQESGHGAVLVSAHFGSPEMAVQGLAADGYSIFGFTEPVEPQELCDFVHWLRSRHGHVCRTVSVGAVKEAMRRLRDGGLVALMLDRDVGGTGVPMEFFGAESRIPLGAVELALRTNSEIIPAWAWRIEDFRFRAEIGPPLDIVRTGDLDADVRTNARRLLAMFEERLRADPGQWAVLEPIWRKRSPEPAAVQ